MTQHKILDPFPIPILNPQSSILDPRSAIRDPFPIPPSAIRFRPSELDFNFLFCSNSPVSIYVIMKIHSLSPVSLFSLFLLLFSTGGAFSVPMFINGGFEMQGDAPLPPGIMVPAGWAAYGHVGVNPVRPEAAVAELGGRNPYADNGIVPEGSRVGYIFGTPLNGNKAGLYQVFQGTDFDPEKTYVLQYYANVSGAYPRDATMIVILGQHNLMNWHRVPRVEEKGSHTRPYTRMISIEFKTNTVAPLLMRVSGASWDGNPTPAPGIENNTGDYRYDCVMLLDDFRFIELGPLELRSARRSYTNHTQVTAVFSDDLPESSVTNLINYRIVGFEVLGAKYGAASNEVVLTTAPIPNDFSPSLRVQGILDKNGLGMFAAKSTTVVDTSGRNPAEFGTALPGFQDDFSGTIRDSYWKVHGTGGDVYRQHHGILKVQTANGTANQLLYENPESIGSVQEVLAKVRVLQMADGGRAGIVVGSQGGSQQGFELLFSSENSEKKMRLKERGKATEAAVAGSWSPQAWYWLRLKYEMGGDGKPVASARFWPADQETVEPNQWQTLNGTGSVANGFAGIAAGENGILSELEFDYVLIKADGLPYITPQLPGGLEMHLEIRREGLETTLRWPEQGSGLLLIQSAPDFSEMPPFWGPVDMTERRTVEGYHILPISTDEASMFYRLVPSGF